MTVPEQVRHMCLLLREKNFAFGNAFGEAWKGDDWEQLTRQVTAIDSERVELQEAIDAKDMIAVRDALCDMVVFIEETFHKLGYHFEDDMVAVIGGVMSRFCRDAEELRLTREKYDKLGVTYEVFGEFPRVFLKSDKDQGSEYPRGKFLKSVGYTKDVLGPPVKPLGMETTFTPSSAP